MARSDWPAALAAITQDGHQAARRLALDVLRGAPERARRQQGHAPTACTARRRRSPTSMASSPPTSSTCRMRCARGCPTTAPRRRPRSRAIRRSCARWGCSSSTASAGRCANGTMRCRASTTSSAASRWKSRRATAGSTAPCSRSARATPDELRLYGLRFPLHHDATIRREAGEQPTRSGLGRGRDPRRERVLSARALRRQRDGPDADPAGHRRRRRRPHRPALGRRRQPVRPGHQHRPRHRLPAAAARQVRRPALLR